MMAVAIARMTSKFRLSRHTGGLFLVGLSSLVRSIHLSQDLKESVEDLVQKKSYERIPDILDSSEELCRNPSLFGFLSNLSRDTRIHVIDEMLRSFGSIRPRWKPWNVYSCLLGYTLQSCDPFPISLCIIQRMLRSGCLPVPQTHVFLTSAWLESRSWSHSAADILLDMKSIGHSPDCGTCNYVITSLCAVDQLNEAMHVLSCIARAGCIPDTDSYGTVIAAMCRARKTTQAVEMLREMVTKAALTPRQDTMAKVILALRKNKEVRKAVGVIELLENEDHDIGFEVYERTVESCLACDEYVLAAKTVMRMTARGFIPYIMVRQRLVEGLTARGDWDLACAVRQRFAELGS
ncbi:hypothetical protein MLD38_001877 [Melastoma candidum]|uniref:Uncharacterized protein n=1 Tax=Melastoma candidum TaxID=119954 RepID=A0ACB9SHY2_9MYRT|nr:hypothetical protein MLD38_001877 [Melastoma candidum]